MLKKTSESVRLRSADEAGVPIQPTRSPLLHPVRTMAGARNLVAAIARAGKSCQANKTIGGCGNWSQNLVYKLL
jgi:hypothetical protein